MIDVQEVIEGMQSYNSLDWDGLKKEIYIRYNGDCMERHFTERDLHALVWKTKKGSIKDLYDFWEYITKLTHWQMAVCEEEDYTEGYNTYFWSRIPKTFQAHIKVQLLLMKLDMDCMVPFPVEKVKKAVEHILSKDRFYKGDSEIQNIQATLTAVHRIPKTQTMTRNIAGDTRPRRVTSARSNMHTRQATIC